MCSPTDDRKPAASASDFLDALGVIRREAAGIRLMAIGVGSETGCPEITAPIYDAAHRLGDGIEEFGTDLSSYLGRAGR